MLVRILLISIAIACFGFGSQAELAAQTTATYIGPNNGNWSNPANWDIGVVPINNGGNTYNVIVPAGKIINFDVPGAGTISGLNLVNTGRINIGTGQALNVSGFALVAGIVTANGAGSSFTAISPLAGFSPSPQLIASNGGVVRITGTDFINNDGYGGGSFLLSTGTGSVLDLSSVVNFEKGDNTSGSFSANLNVVEAGNNGLIDLSNTVSISGGSLGSRDDTLRFWIHSGGNIDLSSLQSITGNSYEFDLDVPNYSLPNLLSASFTTVNTNAFGTVSLPSLSSFTYGRLDIPSLATINAPNLTNIEGSTIRRAGLTSFSTGSITNANNAELHAHSGGVIDIAASSYSYNLSDNVGYSPSIISAVGSGSKVNLNSVVDFQKTGNALRTVEAASSGTIDLKSVQNIASGGGLRFLAQSGGKINLGGTSENATLTGGVTSFETTGSNSAIRFSSSMDMADNTAMNATLNGRFEAERSLLIRATNPANFDLKDGILRMLGNHSVQGVQGLEIISTDAGVPIGTLGNIGQIGQLQIGTNSITSRVILQDSINNNGTLNDREALYLQGFPATNGLSILNGSSLILNGHNAYTSDGQGNFTSLRSLIAPGQRFVAYDAGFISLTGDVGEVINGRFDDGTATTLPSFTIKAPSSGGGGGVVSVPTPGNPNNKAGEIYAGSIVEIGQQVSTFESPFLIEFDAWGQDDSGTLSLLLDDILLDSWSYSELGSTGFLDFSVLIEDPALRGLIDTELTFRWDANSGHRVWLDNIQMVAAVPEPGVACFLMLVGLWLPLQRRRKLEE